MAWYDDILDPSTWTAQGVGTAAAGLGLIGGLTGTQKAPDAPNYAQLAANDTAANRTNQYTPYGSSTWSNDGNTWTNTQSLSGAQQGLLDQSNQLKSNQGNLALGLTGRLGSTLNGAMPGVYDPTQSTNQATDQLMARINPMLDRQGNQLNTQLANQGITQGSEAWKNAQSDFGNQRNDAYTQAALQGINMGQSQQAQQYSQGMTNRNQPLNELNALQNGSQVTNPTFSTAPTASSQVTAGQNSYNAALGGVNANNANNNNTSQGLFGLGTTLFNSK